MLPAVPFSCLSIVCVYISGSDEDEDSKTKRKRAKKEAKRDAKNNAKAQEAVGAEVRCARQGAFDVADAGALYQQRICLSSNEYIHNVSVPSGGQFSIVPK